MRSVVAVFVTHEHLDHSKYAREFSTRGIPVFMSTGTAVALQYKQHEYTPLKAKVAATYKGLKILPFGVEHDAAEPLGFLFEHDGKRLLFATDTYFLRYNFNSVQQYVIECNYDNDTLDDSSDGAFLKERVRRSHMSLQTLLDFFAASDLSDTHTIHVIHASDRNANRPLIKMSLERATGVRVVMH